MEADLKLTVNEWMYKAVDEETKNLLSQLTDLLPDNKQLRSED